MESIQESAMHRIVKLALLGVIALNFGFGTAWSEPQVGKWRYNAHNQQLPFPRSERAQSVWASDRCWSECGSYCAWGMAGCLKEDAQGHCLKLTDKCDRYCQRECRGWGGPLLPVEFPWE